nr:tetratricopeptide repeat protein [Spirochaetota bacterium]
MKKFTLLFYFFAFVALSLFSTSLEEIIDKEIRFNRWEEAKKELEVYIKNKSDDVFAYSLYSAVLKELKLYDEAILALRNAITYEKSDKKKGEIYFNIGNLFYEKKQNDIALEMYEKSIEFDNMSAPCYYMSGLISFEKNNLENALKSWKRYIGLTLDKEKKEKVSQIVTMIEKDVEDKKQAEIKRLEEERLRLEKKKKRKEEEEKRLAEEKRKREAGLGAFTRIPK